MTRSMAGSGLIESACALSALAIGVVVTVPLMLNTGAAMYYKEKMNFVATQVAQFAANDPEPTQSQDATTFANGLLTSMNMNGNATVTFSQDSSTTPPTITANLSASQPTLLIGGASKLLPANITVSGAATVSATPYASGWLVGQTGIPIPPVLAALFGLPSVVNSNHAIVSLVNTTATPPPNGQPAYVISCTGLVPYGTGANAVNAVLSAILAALGL